jgi:hypothetical protein
MNRSLLLSLSALICAATLAGEQPCATGSISHINGLWYQSAIYPSQIEKAPLWHPELELQPPLPPGKALALATRKLNALFPKITDWRAMRVGLEWTLKPDHWYYEVYFARGPQSMPRGGEAQSFAVNVLMSGEVIQPTIRKE